MNEQNLSQWFYLVEQKPWEVGVYELSGDASWHCYAYWDGKSFSYAWTTEISDSLDRAYGYRNDKSQVCWFYKMKKWRGLSTNPEVKKNPANKRKTMFLVIDPDWEFGKREVACFDNRTEAARFVKHRKSLNKDSRIRIEPLRFRTPE